MPLDSLVNIAGIRSNTVDHHPGVVTELPPPTNKKAITNKKLWQKYL
jgi:hypothetical protein